MTRVLVIQHLPHEHSGVLGEVLRTEGVETVSWRAWEDRPLPALDRVDAIAVLGGDMNTDEEDRWPHLAAVRDLLVRAIDADVPTMCLCLGAQLLAEAAGGHVRHGVPEIGYIPVHLTPSGEAHPVLGVLGRGTALHRTAFFNAHQDQIALPPRATLLGYSDDTPVHAFAVGKAVGLQFHPEIDASFVAGYVGAHGVREYLTTNDWEPEELVAAAQQHNEHHRAAGKAVFRAWVGGLSTG